MSTKTNKETTKIVGYGVVGTWVNKRRDGSPNLGGTLPQWLNKSKSQALSEANGNQRLFQFLHNTEQWLCEIIITPIKKLKPKKQFTDY